MKLNYKVLGDGEPIIILHGLFGMLDNWITVARRLSKDNMVVLLDLPNHGRSPRLDPHTYPLLAEVIRNFMVDHMLYNTHLIGHSMGGKIAMQMALDYPELVNKLIVVDIAPRAYSGLHNHVIRSMFEMNVQSLGSRKEASDILHKKLDNDSVVQFLLKNLKHQKGGGYKWKFNLEILNRDYHHIIEAVGSEVPFEKDVLFLRGSESNYIHPTEDIPLIKELFPYSQIKTVDDAGHWLHADQPLELIEILHDFFEQI
jgi:pimeloyl-ACP methyl ester carboxylesterase